jgi:hypothetical protein
MNKTAMLIVCSALVLLAIFTSWAVDSQLSNISGNAKSSASSDTTKSKQDTSVKNTSVVEDGTLICLASKGTSSQQVTSCALGLQLANGTSYALSDNTYKLMGIANGQKIRVHGLLRDHPNSSYQDSGILTVQSVEKL